MIVVSGDSFTEKGHHLSWHDYIFPKLGKKRNLAISGAGNFYIAESIKPFVKSSANKIKKVVIFWSQFFRCDLQVKKPYDKFHGYAGGKCWQFSAGVDPEIISFHVKGLIAKNEKWHQLFTPYIKQRGYDRVMQDSVDVVWDSIKLLETHNIDFKFGFVYNDDLNKQFYDHPNYIPVGFKQFIDDHNLHDVDYHHPSAEGHKRFAEEIKPYIFK